MLISSLLWSLSLWTQKERRWQVNITYSFIYKILPFFVQLKTSFSTDSRVQNMFDILLDEEMEKDTKEKVCIISFLQQKKGIELNSPYCYLLAVERIQ